MDLSRPVRVRRKLFVYVNLDLLRNSYDLLCPLERAGIEARPRKTFLYSLSGKRKACLRLPDLISTVPDKSAT